MNDAMLCEKCGQPLKPSSHNDEGNLLSFYSCDTCKVSVMIARGFYSSKSRQLLSPKQYQQLVKPEDK